MTDRDTARMTFCRDRASLTVDVGYRSCPPFFSKATVLSRTVPQFHSATPLYWSVYKGFVMAMKALILYLETFSRAASPTASPSSSYYGMALPSRCLCSQHTYSPEALYTWVPYPSSPTPSRRFHSRSTFQSIATLLFKLSNV